MVLAYWGLWGGATSNLHARPVSSVHAPFVSNVPPATLETCAGPRFLVPAGCSETPRPPPPFGTRKQSCFKCRSTSVSPCQSAPYHSHNNQSQYLHVGLQLGGGAGSVGAKCDNPEGILKP